MGTFQRLIEVASFAARHLLRHVKIIYAHVFNVYVLIIQKRKENGKRSRVHSKYDHKLGQRKQRKANRLYRRFFRRTNRKKEN
jgi:hypothetical protein